jgi:RNA recognition motif-containing protein
MMQVSKLYVGNLSYSVNNEQLEELFANHGEVKEVRVIEGKGFGFVEMSSSEEAEQAKNALNGTEFEGRTLKIDEARPPRERSGGPRNRPRGDYQSGGYRRY